VAGEWVGGGAGGERQGNLSFLAGEMGICLPRGEVRRRRCFGRETGRVEENRGQLRLPTSQLILFEDQIHDSVMFCP
jgi:hypothetical protein